MNNHTVNMMKIVAKAMKDIEKIVKETKKAVKTVKMSADRQDEINNKKR